MPSLDPRRALALQRVVVAVLLMMHGLFRATHAGYVDGFGTYLDGAGIPAGRAVAYGITAFEVIGGTLLALLLYWHRRQSRSKHFSGHAVDSKPARSTMQ